MASCFLRTFIPYTATKVKEKITINNSHAIKK